MAYDFQVCINKKYCDIFVSVLGHLLLGSQHRGVNFKYTYGGAHVANIWDLLQ